MVRCPRCGYVNEDTDIYCRNCTYPLQDPKTNFRSKKKRDSSWNIGTGKKILLVIGIVVIAFLLFSMIYNVTQPSSQSSLNVVTGKTSGYENSYNPYKVKIVTNGSWYGEVGETNSPNTVSGTGSEVIDLDCASWDNVTIKISKTDYNDHPLTVQLLRNDRVVSENTTNVHDGVIELTN